MIDSLRDINPSMGVKGCRYALINPEFLAMQVRAVLYAGLQVIREGNKCVGQVKFMIPMFSSEHEVIATIKLINEASEKLFHAQVLF